MGLPWVLYDNAALDAGVTITASSEAAGYEAEGALDWITSTAWQANATGAQWIQHQHGSARLSDCAAIYAPEMAGNIETVKLQGSNDGGAWTDITAETTLAAGKPIKAWRYTPQSWTYYRWLFQMTGAVRAVPVAVVGNALDFENGWPVGTAKPSHSRLVDIIAMRTSTGTRAGRLRRRLGCRFNISTSHNTPEFTLTDWLPFLKHAELLPFFLAFDFDQLPNELALLENEEPTAAHAYDSWGTIGHSMNCEGVCNDL